MNAYLENLCHYLRDAPITDFLAPPVGGGGHSNKVAALLTGGVMALVKPENGSPEMERAVSCEEAAFLTAAHLRFDDLVPATVTREVDHPDLGPRRAAVQMLWPDPSRDGVPKDDFPEGERWQAAVFDYLIEHTDRGGGNWFSAPKDLSPPRLRLFDNGYAFGFGGLGSAFVEDRRGNPMPAPIRAAVQRFKDDPPPLDALLPQGEFQKLMARVDDLRTASQFP